MSPAKRAKTETVEIKVLKPGDKVSFEPDSAWQRVRTNAGAISYRVINGGTAGNPPHVEIKHLDKTSQRHPEKGGYKVKQEVMIDGNVMHFPM